MAAQVPNGADVTLGNGAWDFHQTIMFCEHRWFLFEPFSEAALQNLATRFALVAGSPSAARIPSRQRPYSASSVSPERNWPLSASARRSPRRTSASSDLGPNSTQSTSQIIPPCVPARRIAQVPSSWMKAGIQQNLLRYDATPPPSRLLAGTIISRQQGFRRRRPDCGGCFDVLAGNRVKPAGQRLRATEHRDAPGTPPGFTGQRTAARTDRMNRATRPESI
jgi:hypothetical protein